MIALLADLDVLVGTRGKFLLGRWLKDAKRWATARAKRNPYEWNARNIITRVSRLPVSRLPGGAARDV